MDGIKFHEKLVNHIVPMETDLASSWISMAVFKEKQYQVPAELSGVSFMLHLYTICDCTIIIAYWDVSTLYPSTKS